MTFPRRSVALLALILACSGDQSGPSVLTASRALAVGTVLTAELLSETPVAQLSEAGPDAVSPSAIRSVLGRAVLVPIGEGDVLHQGALAPEGVPADLAARTPPRMRAFTVAVSGAEGVRAGDHVDLLQSLKDPTTNEEVVTQLMQNVVVLAVSPFSDRLPGPTPSLPLRQVTLEVLPQEAEALAFGEELGVMQVLLRNPDDLEVMPERGRATLDTIFSGERARLLQKRFNIIQVIRGSGSGGGSAGRGAEPVEEVLTAPLMDRAVESPRLGKVVFRDEQGQFKPLPIRALRTVVYLEGPRARTVVDYVVENPFDRVLEGSLRYPLPQDASPAFFGTFQGALPFDPLQLSKVLPPLADESAVTANLNALTPSSSKGVDWKAFRPARVVEKKQAAQTYEKVVRRRIDPALLEWAGGNDFEARVYPIAAGSLKRVVLVYEQSLSSDGTFLHYAFPMPEGAIAEFEVRLLVDESKSTLAALTVSGEDRLSAFPLSGPLHRRGPPRWRSHLRLTPPPHRAGLHAAFSPTWPCLRGQPGWPVCVRPLARESNLP